jgi:hypothetical protein
MKMIMIFALAILQTETKPEPIASTPLTDIHQRDLSCVASLAIVASEQERNITSALDYPLLSDRGKAYAGLTGQRIMAETGRNREQVRDDIIAALATQQKQAVEAADPNEIVEAHMAKCLPLLDMIVPPPATPTLNQCAAMLELAYREVYRREGLSKTAQDLKTLAAVLDNRAREKLRAEGYSGNEGDILLTTLREKMLGDARAQESKGQSSDLVFEHCFKLAEPKEKAQKRDH